MSRDRRSSGSSRRLFSRMCKGFADHMVLRFIGFSSVYGHIKVFFIKESEQMWAEKGFWYISGALFVVNVIVQVPRILLAFTTALLPNVQAARFVRNHHHSRQKNSWAQHNDWDSIATRKSLSSLGRVEYLPWRIWRHISHFLNYLLPRMEQITLDLCLLLQGYELIVTQHRKISLSRPNAFVAQSAVLCPTDRAIILPYFF